MDKEIFFSFLALVAALIGSSILAVGSITCLNALGAILYTPSNGEDPRKPYLYMADHIQDTRLSMRTYSVRLWWFYVITASTAFIIIAIYVILSLLENTIDKNGLSTLIYFLQIFLFPTYFFVYFLLTGYIVSKIVKFYSVTWACKNDNPNHIRT